MTLPGSRRHRRQGERAPAFAGGSGGDRDITEVLEQARGAVYDGDTYQWGGASTAGLPDGGAFPAVDPAGDYRQAIARAAAAERELAARARARGPQPGIFPALREAPVPAAPPSFTPAGQPDRDTIARDMAQGWPHLFEVRCAYPAAASTTPIPCDSVHRDGAAVSFRALRRSAQAAGWHLDALGRWACARCCQASGEYRTLYPVILWDGNAAAAVLAGDGRGEFWYRAAAELDLIRDVAAEMVRRGRHAVTR